LAFQLGACDIRRIGDRLGALDPLDLQALQVLAKKIQKLI
jgi:hypothetical protein